MSSRRLFTMLTVTLALTTAGCAAGGDGGGADAVEWTDDVCGALAPFATAASAQPAVDPADPAGMVRELGIYLGSTASAVQDSVRGLEAAGPAPVEGGDEYVDRLTETLTKVGTSFSDAEVRLSGVDTSSAESVATALPDVVAPLQELGALADPTDGLRSTDELRAAADQAPRCQQLRTG